MKHHHSAKYHKRRKKELANRKAKQLAVVKIAQIPIAAESISAARRAFQDV